VSRSSTIAVLFYVGAMLVGAAVGIFVDRQLVQGRLERMSQDPRTVRQTFFTDLKFTSQQRTAWDSVWSARMRADSALMAPIMPQRDSLRKATNERLRALLTPEQLKLYDERQQHRPRPGDGRR